MKLYTPSRSASIKAPHIGSLSRGKVAAGPRTKMGSIKLKTIRPVKAKGAKITI